MSRDSGSLRAIEVGSFPLDADMERYLRGAYTIEMGVGETESEDSEYFISKHNDTFLAKADALGPESAVVCYAQCRGMIDQFLLPVIGRTTSSTQTQTSTTVSFGGIPKEAAQSVAIAAATGQDLGTGPELKIAEITALQRSERELTKRLGVDEISYKSCITGPLELALNLQRLAEFPRTYDEKLVEFFTEVVRLFVKGSLVNTGHLTPAVITIDEPAFGLEGVGDFFTDTKSDARLEHLISCWNSIYDEVPSDCYRGIHLHASPFEQAFNANWNLLEAHVGVYVSGKWLEDYDKFVRAAIVRTDGPTIDKGEDVKAAWQRILSGDFQSYLQSVQEMEKYLRENIKLYGVERVPFAGPECGLGPWDWKNGEAMALLTLKRMSSLLRDFN
ncbi:MAG: hypothetical protein JSW61_06115 [Candidatus Thorarchaeota archaeon]|nr:MAG: hypothetical protein JSW61_06115 [Candidatus Thorarchaeota archaeon]